MVVDIETGRNLCYKAAWLHSTGQPYEMGARYAKAFMGEATARITRDAIQVHGGVGYTKELPVERFYRDAPLMAVAEGTNEIQRIVIARRLLEMYAVE